MPLMGYRTITVDEETYNRLKELAESKRVSISKVVRELVFGKSIDKSLEETLRKIIREEISKIVEERKDKKGDKAIKETLLGRNKPITIKDGSMVISKAQIFVKGAVPTNLNLARFRAKAVDEFDESGNPIGVSIVPDLGFNDISLEEWVEKYGIPLVKTIVKHLVKH